ncbi:hypothetical protein ABGT23_01885 [Enterobacter cloacae]|uniref:hypothetical protein n=1 Tax=Enterobacter cloacae TaxID=550 RepID=UPI00345C9107
MKNKIIISAAFLACASALNANAVGMSPEITIKGDMSAPGCTINTPNNGQYELGKISASIIRDSDEVSLPSPNGGMNWTVQCEAATFLSFQVVDNREGTASKEGSTHFGLGPINGEGKIGYYRVKMFMPKVDSSAASLYTTSGSTFDAVKEVYLEKGKTMGWASGNNEQALGTSFSAYLDVLPVLASSKDMNGPVADSSKIDGAMTMNFSFGL